MRLKIKQTVALLLVLVVISAFATEKFVILHTSNVYGNALPYNYFADSYLSHGLSVIASVSKEENEKNKNVLLIDTGNLFFGSPFGDYYSLREDNPLIEAIKLSGYDYIVPGTFELNKGKNFLENVSKELPGKVLAANLVDVEGLAEYSIKRLPSGFKVGIIGITARYGDLKFVDANKKLKDVLKKVKEQEKVDFVILAVHGGFEKDPVTGKKIVAKSEFDFVDELLKDVTGIDLVLFGNQEFAYLNKSAKNVVYSNPGSSKYVSKIVVDVKEENGTLKKTITSMEIVDLTKLDPDKEVLNYLIKFEDNVNYWLSEKVGAIERNVGFNNRMALFVDEPITEYVNKAIIDFSGAQIGIWNIFNPSFTGLVKGSVTIADVYKMVGVTTKVRVLEVTGKELLDLLKSDVEYYIFKDEQVFVKDTVSKDYSLVNLFENIFYKIVPNDVPQVRDVIVAGKPVDNNQKYYISIPSKKAKNIQIGKVVRAFEYPVHEIVLSKVLNEKNIDLKVDDNRAVYVRFDYTVAPGDTFKKIVYRAGVPEEEILKINPHIKNVDLIRPGWKITYYKKYIELLPPFKGIFERK